MNYFLYIYVGIVVISTTIIINTTMFKPEKRKEFWTMMMSVLITQGLLWGAGLYTLW
jgi:hypothetical protein